ncbi:hypothetical protein PN36_12045 [Candidatus Thiomargarita nelsonii]|uniref:Uncharacterized protein n=1 Tax=Candidatus Thiomargarita nelsonii TaxID=1003181 RepID=A0A0A6PJH9_9GAMM|nr:hypothetical protein PN36_12045 [Candidatus Thiomargarita nelsonii]
MNKLKFLPLIFILLIPLGCGEEGVAAIDVVKKRITNQIQGFIGKGDIAIQKYENKIGKVRDNLIKVKVSRKSFEQKLETRKTSLASYEQKGASEAKIELLTNTIQEMETFLQQVQTAESKLEKMLKKLIDNLDLVKIKVAALEAKRDMLDAMRTIQEYSNIEGDVDDLGGNMDNTLEEMQKEIYAIEAEIEIDNLLSQAEGL